MYFTKTNIFDLSKNINNLNTIYAHTKAGDKEGLKEHLDLSYKYFLRIVEEKNLDLVFKNIEQIFLKDRSYATISLWKELIVNTIYMHDIGKINANFQYKAMDNDLYKDIKQVNSKHSMLSACIYLDYYISKIIKLEEEDMILVLTFLTLNSYVISRHHSSLKNFKLFQESLFQEYNNFLEYHKNLYEDYHLGINTKIAGVKSIFKMVSDNLELMEKLDMWNCVDIYIYTKLIFSLLVTSDFYATSHYMNEEVIDFGIIDDYRELDKTYKESKILKSIYNYKDFLRGKRKNPFKKDDINLLRTQLFLEAEENLIKNRGNSIFYLEAPTGSGKTNVSINLALKLLKEHCNINKIFYIFPFNTLVEQTKDSLDQVFEKHPDIKNQISVINSITPIKTEDKQEENKEVFVDGLDKKIDYKKSLLNRQFLHYPIILTTHVNFFNYLFGNSRESVFAISHIANSVIILDEIQSYKNNIWKEIIIFLKKYADILNLKIIIMSATLPKLDKLIDSKEGFISLIENRNMYYNNTLFKDRVKLDYSLLDESEDVCQKLIEKIISLSKESTRGILIEFINKGTAINMYKKINERYKNEDISRELLLMTGDDNKIERKQIIKKIKEQSHNKTLIATQVIEAGVDIDMDIGFKDISILDSEEQFLGRINRSCMKKDSVVYFFDLDKASTIYKNDYRKNNSVTLKEEKIKDILINKRFDRYYKIIMEMIEEDLYKHTDTNIDKFRENKILKLDYEAVTERMKLIDDDRKEYQVFLNRNIKDENNNIILGECVWNEYVKLLQDKRMNYEERKVKLSYVMEKMSYFIYNVNDVKVSYEDVVGNIFYIEDGEKYFINGKFDREEFKDSESFEII